MPSSQMREGFAEVPGATLRYRLTGASGELPTIVLENGWGVSYDYFALMQNELAPHAQLLLYNRAGIGGSTAHVPQTAEGMSHQLGALLDLLGIHEPVVIAGQSYGGLICGVHAALIPQRLYAIVQIDPTAERPDPQIDSTAKTFRVLARLMIVLAKLRVPELLFARQMELPPQDAVNLRRHALGSAASLRAALIEMDLLSQIRETCALSSATPRLVISAEKAEEMSGFVSKLISPERRRKLIGCMQAQHQITAARGGKGSQWTSLPHTHGNLVYTRVGASATAACMVNYLRKLQATT